MAVIHVKHPMIEHKISILRDKNTSCSLFRQLVSEIGTLMAYEATRDLKLVDVEIETPVSKTTCKMLAGKKMVIVPILRAGLGMVDGIHSVVPNARIGHIGMERDPKTLEITEYLCKLPSSIAERHVLLVDPMLATGNTAIAAIDSLKAKGCTDIKLICLVGCPEGIEKLTSVHPDVDIVLAAIDERLNEKSYIVPGLGDAGDRIFGTK